MCGIAGYYGFNDQKLLKKFSKELFHRGPDGEGFYFENNLGLLNRRLAIIDILGGDQPIYNEDKSVVVVYNGEIYNYLDLKAELINCGHVFLTESDTEVIVHGYEEWGTKCFDKFNGMFAIALYDKAKNKTILVRDHFGIKPLHYSIFDNKLIFSSEIKPLFYSGLIEKKPNDKIIYRYLKYRIHDDGRETFFKNINRLLPGEMMEIENGKFTISKYSDLFEKLGKIKLENATDQEIISKFKEELLESIKKRLIADVRVGSCLSGGLDSSTVVCAINNFIYSEPKRAESVGKRQRTFSAVFPTGTNNEEKYINEVLDFLTNDRLQAYKIYPASNKFLSDIKDFIKTQEEPTISTGPYAQYDVMRTASKYVKVVLDGQGADEMMAGYMPYYFVYLKELFIKKKYLTLSTEIISSKDVLTKYFYLKYFGKKTVNVDGLLNDKFRQSHYKEKFVINNENLQERLKEDILKNSLQSLLRYEDRNSMRFSIEGRVPFLDFNLLKLIFSLPPDFIIRKGWNKYVLREAGKGIVPEMIRLRRNKIGFTTPEQQWFEKLSPKFMEIFESKKFLNRKYFDANKVISSFNDFISGKNEDTMAYWRIINVELWLREFFD